jgi:hypothetical protein
MNRSAPRKRGMNRSAPRKLGMSRYLDMKNSIFMFAVTVENLCLKVLLVSIVAVGTHKVNMKMFLLAMILYITTLSTPQYITMQSTPQYITML